ncbi:MAG: TlpA disulfide reductase family protein [Methylococcales bacterium]|nr:TlpA disulfide reductase family protein [Methylococcales bacterium]
MTAQISQKAPQLAVSAWLQGGPTNLDQLLGHVVLVEVFQVNCPGCFLYALPLAVDLHHRYADQGLVVLGVATAFEDFDKNNLENLVRLLENGEVVGETLRHLDQQGQLVNGRLNFNIPFPVGMDNLQNLRADKSPEEITAFIQHRVPDFEQLPASHQQQIHKQAELYFQALSLQAETFKLYDLQGTPSYLLIDKRGLLRESALGLHPELETRIQALLQE